jgi:hypothetical protein
MDIKSFEHKVLKPIKKKCPYFNERRVEVVYEDLYDIYELIQGTHKRIKKFDVFDLVKTGRIRKAKNIRDQDRQIVTLLKAQHLFAEIFISMLIGEVLKKPSLSLNSFIDKPQEPLNYLSPQDILPAYCVIVYRNKIIAHHAEIRGNAYFSDKNGEKKFFPHHSSMTFPKEVINELDHLARKYSHAIPSLNGVVNPYNQMEILFYNIPLGILGKKNPDRLAINKLAEKGNCKSMSQTEIINAVDNFSLAVTKSI